MTEEILALVEITELLHASTYLSWYQVVVSAIKKNAAEAWYRASAVGVEKSLCFENID